MATVLRDKSLVFALRIVKACRYLAEENREYVLSKQLMRSGTAIGALVWEAEYAETKQDFIHKLAIARKEASETAYWLELLAGASLLTTQQASSLQADVTELLKVLTSSIKTAKSTLPKATPKE